MLSIGTVGLCVGLGLLLWLAASGAYSRGVLKILDGTIDSDTTATKIGLAKSTYAPDPDESALTTFAASEADCTGYTGAFGGAGRKSATITLTEQTASNRVVTIITDLTWTALGGASNNTLGYAVWLREVTNDAASIPIAYLNFSANVTTNGSDILVDFDGTNGNVRWSV
jgi:hypothetical protein